MQAAPPRSAETLTVGYKSEVSKVLVRCNNNG